MSETTTTTRITQVGTIGIPVGDQDRAREFYTAKLGFETRVDAAYGEGQRWIEVAPTDFDHVHRAHRSARGLPCRRRHGCAPIHG